MESEENRSHGHGVDWLLEAIGDKSLVFQDLLDAGYDLPQVEEFSDRARALGHSPVTVTAFLGLTQQDRPMQSRVLPHILGRLKHES